MFIGTEKTNIFKLIDIVTALFLAVNVDWLHFPRGPHQLAVLFQRVDGQNSLMSEFAALFITPPKSQKNRFQPAFGMSSTQTLAKIYNIYKTFKFICKKSLYLYKNKNSDCR